MKKRLTVILCCLAFAANAKKIAAASVPAAVKATFAKSFSTATGVKWELEKDGGYEAAFKQGAEKLTATFDATGACKETEKEIPVASLPASVTQYLKAHNMSSKVKEAAELKMAGGSTHFEAQVNGKDMIFDGNGNLLKTVKD